MANTAVLKPLGGARAIPGAAALIGFALLFGPALIALGVDWANSSEYGHGFLFLPIAGWLAWRNRAPESVPSAAWGTVVIVGSIALFLAALAAGEFFSRRVAALGGLIGISLFFFGWAQVRAWWLSFALILFTIPLPEVVLNSITLPLQLLASRMAVWLLDARHVPVELAGNIIFLPGQELFVAEACSGLRSLSALIGLTLLIAGTALQSGWARGALVLVAIPAALLANAFRVFGTGFGAYYVGPEVTEGALHTASGAAVFVLGFMIVGGIAWVLHRMEAR